MADALDPTAFEPPSFEWLLLRHDADRDARSQVVESHVHEHLEDRDLVRVLDIGAGAGASMIYLAPRLPVARQQWTLIDRGPALAERVRTYVSTFQRRIPGIEHHGDEITFDRNHVTYQTLSDDFLRPASPIYDQPVDLVVAHALFDLLSADQLDRFLALAMSRWRDAQPAFYFTIHLDHGFALAPAHPDDDRVRALFHAHMQRLQSFGRALGSDSATVLVTSLRAIGLEVVHASSPWRIGARETAFLQANLDFVEDAARDMIEDGAGGAGGSRPMNMDELERWLAHRRDAIAAEALTMEIAHQDIWATWPNA